MDTKEFLMLLVRWGLVSIGSVLVYNEILPKEVMDALTNYAIAPLVGVIMIVGAFLLKWLKQRFDKFEKANLYQANPDETTRMDVKADTYKDNKFVLPI